MGWKSVKEHYKIQHIVHIKRGNLCIGSGYINNIIEVTPAGEFVERYDRASNKELARYQQEIAQDLALFARLMSQQDHFMRSITVYTYDDSNIIEKQCEETGWPNVTHDGELMYENTFSTDRNVIVETALRNAKAHHEMTDRALKQALGTVQDLEKERAMATQHIETLLKMKSEAQ